MQYRLIDGHVVSGDTYAEIVKKMASEKFVKPSNLEVYRKATAIRIEEMYGDHIRWDTDEHFVKDMVEAALMEEVE